MVVYKTTNTVNGKIYVGKDKHNSPSYLGSGKRLQEAIKKYGKGCFVKEVLQEYETEEAWIAGEKYWISKLQSTDKNVGYNLTDGGEGGNTKKYWTEERLQRYKEDYLFSKKPSGYTSLSQKGKHITECLSSEQAAKWRKNFTEAVQKTSERRKNKQYTEAELEGYKKQSILKQGKGNPNATKVRCLETGKVYGTVKEAMFDHGYKSLTKIQASYRSGRPTTDGFTFVKE